MSSYKGRSRMFHPYPTKVGCGRWEYWGKVTWMTADQIHILRKSFDRVEQQGEVAALLFYRRLFELDPSLRALFQAPITEQGAKLLEMLAFSLSIIDRPAILEAELLASGVRHVQYGARDEHYDLVKKALMDTLAGVLGKELTSETRQAWETLLDYVCDTMKRGASQIEPACSEASHSKPPIS